MKEVIIRNYVDQQRIDKTVEGIEYQHLADILYDGRSFLVYKNLQDGQAYIEEKVNKKLSDSIVDGKTELKYIEDDHLWARLLHICNKEGIIPGIKDAIKNNNPVHRG